MPFVFDHNSERYKEIQSKLKKGKSNGAYYYSCEIVKNIIPKVKTKRAWVTINCGLCENGAIVFIHNNKDVEKYYSWLKDYQDLICVCSVKETCQKVEDLGIGKAVYLPLSVDIAEIEKYKKPKTKEACYVGNLWAWKMKDIVKMVPRGTRYLTEMSRDELLRHLSQYKVAYAIGRCAIEAKILGCEVRPCDSRYPNPDIWKVLDNKDAAKMLQKELDKIDGKDGKDYKPIKQPIIDTDNPKYIEKRSKLGSGQFNGAYYYSKEIVKNIIPRIKTDRPWDTLGMKAVGTYHRAIVFIHHNIEMDRAYKWLKDYEDLVLITSSPYTQEWAEQAGYKAIYVPLSIDTEYVKQFKTKKTKDTCFCGNIWSFRKDEIDRTIPEGVDFQPKNINREALLKFMAPYKKVYAIGRCALEAQCLGAEILQCYKKFDVAHWKLMDNKEAAKILQDGLDKIDGKRAYK
jgi:hypothetical protein